MDDAALLALGLAGYVRAVAEEVGVPPEGTEFEVADTTTAYLALPERPGPDLMLLWSGGHGWSVAVETRPSEPPVTVAHLGAPLVPPPEVVARFVADVLAGGPGRPEPSVPEPSAPEPSAPEDRRALARELGGYAP
ncbi:DUF6292 family protein [Saccharothrix longispora]|uniref:DUF6292 family protein n=1 Tax=Saccharothrix longispora TaxID=33920 RepID=UPI0028FD06EF|nr:DUF6292 family protein [Saccharothrix longispora]MDU0288244.1 DUF6292 family protein [Saccharothrix longispora]